MTDIAKTLSQWWHANLRPSEDSGAARGLRARLRRADALGVLAQPQVHDLVAAHPWLRHRPEALIRAVQVLAVIERNDPRPLARLLGTGDPPAASPPMSPARFERLIRSDPADLARALRRALPLSDGACNVGALGRDVLNWDRDDGDRIRRDWYFDYFNASRPLAETKTGDLSE